MTNFNIFEPLHKVGDKIKIKSNLKMTLDNGPNYRYRGIYKNGEKTTYGIKIDWRYMKYFDKVVTISKIFTRGNIFYYYIVGNKELVWLDEMFEEVPSCYFESLI